MSRLRFPGVPWFLAALLLAGCDGSPMPAQEAGGGLRLQDALGGEAGEFLRADAPRVFRFPDDHGLHPGFRNEWWYFTGNLATAEGRRFGYQLTFFTNALPRSEPLTADGEARVSAWDSPRIWMAHLAVTDVAGRQHHAFERFSRENPGLAGAQVQPQFRVWLDDWQLRGSATADTLPWQLQAAEAGIGLQLQLDALKAPVLQGEAGLSRKSATPGNASYYYSMTRLATRGELVLGEARFSVAGLSWLDREWSSSALETDQVGWDWFSLQFDDGTELMLYQLRTTGGGVHPYSAGYATSADGQQQAVDLAALQLEELASWVSPGGIAYPTRWSLLWQGRRLEVAAIVQEQWMDLSIPYWEGAVEIRDARSGAVSGRGYLELVR